MIPTYLERLFPDAILSDIDWESKPKTCSGDRYEPTYSPVVDSSGRFDLKEKKEKVDVYASIQSFKDSVDINRIIERLSDGDTSVLNKWSGFYADVSSYPDNLAAWLQMQSDAEIAFYDLPLEIREKFNHDPNQFIASFGTEKFESIFKKEDSGASVETSSDVTEKVGVENE